MTTIVKRITKGSPLTFAEMDANWENLNSDKLEKFVTNATITEDAGPYTFSPGSPATNRHEFMATDDGGLAAGPHTLRVQFDLTASGYFAQIADDDPAPHIAVVLHQDPALVATNVRGNGILIGNCNNGLGEATPYAYNSAMIETWMGGTASTNDNRVFPGTELPPIYALEDGIDYRFIVSSTVDDLDNKWVRYAVYKSNTSVHPEGAWDLLWDTGHVLDFNEWADFTKKGIFFASVFEPTSYSVTLSNIKIAWGPVEPIVTAVRKDRFGSAGATGMFPTYAAGGDTGDYTFNMTGWDNTNIKDFASDGWNWNNILDSNDIKTALSTGGYGLSAAQSEGIEVWVARPLYCMVAKILYHMKQRGW